MNTRYCCLNRITKESVNSISMGLILTIGLSVSPKVVVVRVKGNHFQSLYKIHSWSFLYEKTCGNVLIIVQINLWLLSHTMRCFFLILFLICPLTEVSVIAVDFPCAGQLRPKMVQNCHNQEL